MNETINNRIKETKAALDNYVSQRDWLNAGLMAAEYDGLDEAVYLHGMEPRLVANIIKSNEGVLERIIRGENWFDAARMERKIAAMKEVFETAETSEEAAEKESPQ